MVGPGLIVVIPAYREAATIGDVVAGAFQYAPVIVVDDASDDDTAAVAAAAGAQVVSNAKNLGYEGALNAGFSAAAAHNPRAILTMDADGQHAADHVPSFMRVLLDEEVPLVLGYRAKMQRPAEAIIGAIVRTRFNVKDVFCGMKGYHTDLWRRHGCFDSTNGVGAELALAAIRGGVSFRELPVSGEPRVGTPRFDGWLRANFRMVRALGRSLSAPPLKQLS